MLNDTERAVLDIEAKVWRFAGAKEAAIAASTGLSPVRYYQLLTGLLDRRDALEHDAVTVNRLRRVRDNRRRPAAATTQGGTP